MKIESHIVFPHVYLLIFPTQYDLCMSFVRIQEFYESPKFRGKYFTLEDYIDYWSKTMGNGSFTYPSVWNGFNVPGEVLYNWMNKFSEKDGDLRDREIEILKAIRKLMHKEMGFTLDDDIEKIYVIGAHKKSSNIDGIVNHESAHAFYCLYPEYKKSCNKILKKIGSEEMEKMEKTLITLGYNKKVIKDEIQAYSSVNSGLIYNSYKDGFKKNFEEFKKNLVNKKD